MFRPAVLACIILAGSPSAQGREDDAARVAGFRKELAAAQALIAGAEQGLELADREAGFSVLSACNSVMRSQRNYSLAAYGLMRLANTIAASPDLSVDDRAEFASLPELVLATSENARRVAYLFSDQCEGYADHAH